MNLLKANIGLEKEKNNKNYVFPFSAIVGQEKLKRALLLNCINSSIGGILISGEKGTAKSTIVRSLAHLMPELKVINLPLNATEDMVLGGIDIEKALKKGDIAFSPGILSKAHNNILYIDEINLLSESILNTILDASASGICKIEREGISYSFPSKFILIGSMNPEEGGLHPQILDRFGFYIDVEAEMNIRTRMKIISERLRFENNPAEFQKKYYNEQALLLEQIENAKKLVSQLSLSESTIRIIAEICHHSFVAGHRGDIAYCNGVIANAAFEGRKSITRQDIEYIRELALAHRIRSVSQEQNESENLSGEDSKEDNNSEDSGQDKQEQNNDNLTGQNSAESQSGLSADTETESLEKDKNSKDTEQADEELFEIGELSINADIIEFRKDRIYRNSGSGKRCKTKTNARSGHYVKVKVPKKEITDLAFDATLRAAAPFQKIRAKSKTAISVLKQDIREKVREKRVGNTILFLLDTSGSMGVNRRMTEAKAAVFELLKESYKKRDTVGLMRFNHNDANLELQPTRSLDLAYKCLKDIKTGGKTPLASGISRSVELMKALLCKNPEILPVVVILSDGRANYCDKGENPLKVALETAKKASKESVRYIVIDTETGFIRLEMAKQLAAALNAEYYRLEELKQINKIINQ